MPNRMPGRTPGAERWLDAPEDALDPGFHGVRTPWIPGFTAFQLARRTPTVMRMVSA